MKFFLNMIVLSGIVSVGSMHAMENSIASNQENLENFDRYAETKRMIQEARELLATLDAKYGKNELTPEDLDASKISDPKIRELVERSKKAIEKSKIRLQSSPKPSQVIAIKPHASEKGNRAFENSICSNQEKLENADIDTQVEQLIRESEKLIQAGDELDERWAKEYREKRERSSLKMLEKLDICVKNKQTGIMPQILYPAWLLELQTKKNNKVQ